jgi:hypothetical protein
MPLAREIRLSLLTRSREGRVHFIPTATTDLAAAAQLAAVTKHACGRDLTSRSGQRLFSLLSALTRLVLLGLREDY